MKVITKKHNAKITKADDGINLELEITDEGQPVENLDKQQMQEHYRVEVVAKNVAVENSKYKKLAMAGKKAGDSVVILQKYLVD